MIKRAYTAYGIVCADQENTGFLVEHADDGSGNRAPMLYSRRSKATRALKKLRPENILGAHMEVVEVEVFVRLRTVAQTEAQP